LEQRVRRRASTRTEFGDRGWGPTTREWQVGDGLDTRNVHRVLAAIDGYWSPRTIAVVNDYDVQVVKVRVAFTAQPSRDRRVLLVLSGRLTIRMDERDVVLDPGDTSVVPRGCWTVNTGDTPSAFTDERRVA
jgi:mannose-6-phosphate isomerase-like protein (cupin superfamily)